MIQSVDRSLHLMNILKDHPNGLGVTELANHLDLAKSTVHRMLSTLELYGYVQKTDDRALYRLGLKFIEMHHAVVNQLDIIDVAKPIINDLNKQTEKIVHLVMLDGDEVVYIHKVEAKGTIRIYSQIGKRAPLYCTGVGKVLMSHSNDEQVENYLQKSPFYRFTERTITTPEEFRKELTLIRNRGFAVDDEEHEDGVKCIAAPIFDHKGEAKYAISITSMATQMTEDDIEILCPKLMQAGLDISRKMGYLGHYMIDHQTV